MNRMKRLLPVLLSVLFLFCQSPALLPVMAEETEAAETTEITQATPEEIEEQAISTRQAIII